MTQKRAPLKPGDRVRVAIGTERYDGTVFEVKQSGDNPIVLVKFGDSHPDYTAWSSQCRRLKKKPRPPKERVERWIAGTCDIKNGDPYWQEAWANPIKIGTEHIHLVELREGEAILDRTALLDLIGDTLNEDPGLLVGTIEKWKELLTRLRKEVR